MISKYFSKAGKFLKFLSIFIAVAFLSDCSSYNNVASSFGKRKYTKGHFFDPVAKLVTSFKPGGPPTTVNSAANPQNPTTENSTPAKNTTKQVQANFTAQNNAVTVKDNKHKAVEETATISNNTTSTTGTDNVSVKENSNADPYVGQNNHVYHHDDSKQSTYLVAWLVCLALSLLLILLLVSWSTGANNSNVNSGSFQSTGCILGLLLLFTVVGSIVFFILWVVALSS